MTSVATYVQTNIRVEECLNWSINWGFVKFQLEIKMDDEENETVAVCAILIGCALKLKKTKDRSVWCKELEWQWNISDAGHVSAIIVKSQYLHPFAKSRTWRTIWHYRTNWHWQWFLNAKELYSFLKLLLVGSLFFVSRCCFPKHPPVLCENKFK